MQIKEFSLITPVIEAASVFKALETAIPSAAIQQAIDKTHSQQERQRKLPSELVISLVIAMSLWSSVSMRTVLKNLVNGFSRKWIQLGEHWQVPSSSSISEARGASGMQSNDSAIRAGRSSHGFTTNGRGFFGWITSYGSRWNSDRCPR